MSTSQRIQLPSGLGLTAARVGTGPTVLLNPGMAMPLTTWELTGLPQALVDAGFSVITYSARGVAPSDAPPAPYSVASMADDAAALLDHFGVDEAILVGYSMGCYITQALVGLRPNLARGVVLCSGLASSEIGRLVNEMELDLIRRVGDVPAVVDAFETILTTLDPRSLQDQPTVRGWRDMLIDGASSWTSPEGHHGQVAASNDWMQAGEPTPERLASITVPTLVLAYEHDLFFPPATSRAAAELIEGAQFAQIDGFAHGGIMLDPQHTATAHIVEFCAGLI